MTVFPAEYPGCILSASSICSIIVEESRMSSSKRLLCVLVFLGLSLSCFAQAAPPTGSVTISYSFNRQLRIASNQYAIWIETNTGSFVKTLFATDFTAKKAGWKRRPQSVPTWVAAADVKNTPQKDIDAVSGATQRTGTYKVVWDLRDSSGKTVPAGAYKYIVEANIAWEKRVVWTGTIAIGSGPQQTTAVPSYSTADAASAGKSVTDVSAVYAP